MNRYSPIVQPTIVNPISFEEFARVPLAEANAKAAGLYSTQMIDTEYDVDEKDLLTADNLIKTVTKEKDSLVNNILDEGVTNQTINKFLKVKKTRDKVYKDFLTVAQENKKKIALWRSTLDAMSINGKRTPQFTNLVKETEYNKWDGTINEDGSTKEFNPYYGPEEINTDQDIINTLQNIKTTYKGKQVLKNLSFKGYDKYGKVVMTDEQGEYVYDNTGEITAAIDMLFKDYKDPETVRGAFADYTKLDEKDLFEKLNYYKDIFTEKDVKPYGGGTHLFDAPMANDGGGKNPNPFNSITPTGLTTGADVKIPTGFDLSKSGAWLETVNKEMEKSQSKSMDKTFDDLLDAVFGTETDDPNAPHPFKEGPSIGNKEKPGWFQRNFKIFAAAGDVILMGTISNLAKNLEPLISAKNVSDKNKLKVISYFSGAYNKLEEDNVISKEDKLNMLKGDKVTINRVYGDIVDHVSDLADTKGGLYDIYQGDNLRQMLGKDTKTPVEDITKDVKDNIFSLTVTDLETRGKDFTKDKKELWKMMKDGELTVRGVLPAGSPLTTDKNGKYRKELSQAYVLTDKDGKEYLASRLWEPREGGEIGNEFRINQDLEKYLVSLKFDIQYPIAVVGQDNQQIRTFVYRDSGDGHIKLGVGDTNGKPIDLYNQPSAWGYIIPPKNVDKAIQAGEFGLQTKK